MNEELNVRQFIDRLYQGIEKLNSFNTFLRDFDDKPKRLEESNIVWNGKEIKLKIKMCDLNTLFQTNPNVNVDHFDEELKTTRF